jgi:hypothetical protein
MLALSQRDDLGAVRPESHRAASAIPPAAVFVRADPVEISSFLGRTHAEVRCHVEPTRRSAFDQMPPWKMIAHPPGVAPNFNLNLLEAAGLIERLADVRASGQPPLDGTYYWTERNLTRTD